MSRRCVTDWFRVLVDLDYLGVKTTAVSRMINVPRSTVAEWKYGREPKHSDGEKLIVLWCHSMKKSRKQLPVIDRKSSKALLSNHF